ncbi:MAG: hypothetical protein IJ193_03945 [Bacilli bacterium]|nr:hypothetical protein [Bacilli bacterium]
MFSEEAKKFIELEVTNIDGRADSDLIVEDVARKINCLEQAIRISEHVERLSGLKSAIVDQIEYMAKNKKVDSIEEFEKTAQFLELFIYLINPTEFKTIQGTAAKSGVLNNSQAIPDYLYELGMLKEKRDVGYIRCTYKDAKSYNSYSDMFKVFGNLYYARNEVAHSVRKLSPTQEWQYVHELLIIYLEVAGKYEQKLNTEINRIDLIKNTDVKNYLEKVKSKFESDYTKKKDLSYIALDGREVNTSSKKSLVSLIRNKENCKIKIIGNAGMGKTTTLMYLAYTDITEPNGRTPIVLELKEAGIDDTVIGMIGNNSHLGCPEETVKQLLENGYINLYIDGINEIYNENVKRNIVSQINNIITTYPKTKIILTDRESNNITVTDNVLIYVIEQLDDEKIDAFINQNTSGNEELKKKVKELVNGNEALKNMVRIPFRLYKLITIVKNGREIPSSLEGFDIEFRNAIIEREIEEKASADADNLIIYLENILSLNQKEYKRTELINIISLTIKDNNLSETSSDGIVKLLLDLHIMEKVDFQTYRFENYELQKITEDKKEAESEDSKAQLEGVL